MHRTKTYIILFALHLFIAYSAIAGTAEFSNSNNRDMLIKSDASLVNITAQSLIVKGDLTFSNLKVEGSSSIHGNIVHSNGGEFKDLSVVGNITVDRINCNKLVSSGDVNLYEFKINKLEAMGRVTMEKGELTDLKAISTKIILKDTKVHSITFNHNGCKRQEELYLKGNTVVTGDIMFQSGRGIVIMQKNAKVKGRIFGGGLKKINL